MRLTPDQLKSLAKRGMISANDLEAVTRAQKGTGGGGVSKREPKYPHANGPFSPVEGFMPQEILWRGILGRWPKSGPISPVWEHPVPIPGKAGPPYRIDIAFPSLLIGIEMDGWESHGRFKEGFQRDRRRDRLLAIHGGWRLLRFYAAEVRDELPLVLDQIELVLTQTQRHFGANGRCRRDCCKARDTAR